MCSTWRSLQAVWYNLFHVRPGFSTNRIFLRLHILCVFNYTTCTIYSILHSKRVKDERILRITRYRFCRNGGKNWFWFLKIPFLIRHELVICSKICHKNGIGPRIRADGKYFSHLYNHIDWFWKSGYLNDLVALCTRVAHLPQWGFKTIGRSHKSLSTSRTSQLVRENQISELVYTSGVYITLKYRYSVISLPANTKIQLRKSTRSWPTRVRFFHSWAVCFVLFSI